MSYHGSSDRSVPKQIPYQGVLERDGQLVNAIGGDTVSFRVSLWDSATDGTRVWPEADQVVEYEEHSVNVYDGRFAFNIGSEVPYRHVADTGLYLDIQVMGPDDTDFVPLGGRQRFLSSPFAVAASRSDGDFLVDSNLNVIGNTTTSSINSKTLSGTGLTCEYHTERGSEDTEAFCPEGFTLTGCNCYVGNNDNGVHCDTIITAGLDGCRVDGCDDPNDCYVTAFCCKVH
jgi:hypothetical protein